MQPAHEGTLLLMYQGSCHHKNCLARALRTLCGLLYLLVQFSGYAHAAVGLTVAVTVTVTQTQSLPLSVVLRVYTHTHTQASESPFKRALTNS